MKRRYTSCRTILRATCDGQNWSNAPYLTDVWAHRDGELQLVRRHASRVTPGAA